MKQGGRGDEKRGRGRDREGKGGPDEWNKVERDREKRERERERDKPKVDTNRIRGLTKRGEKSKEVRTVLCIIYVHNAGMPCVLSEQGSRGAGCTGKMYIACVYV